MSLHSSPLLLFLQHVVLVPAMEVLHAMERMAAHKESKVCEKKGRGDLGSDMSRGRVGICHL